MEVHTAREAASAVDAATRPDAMRPRDVSPADESSLRGALITTDLVVLLPAWTIAVLGPWTGDVGVAQRELLAPVATALTIAAMAIAGLYRSRVCAVRATEAMRTAHAVIVAACITGAIAAGISSANGVAVATLGAAFAFVAVCIGRAAFREWLRAQRAAGHRLREVLVVGADAEAQRVAVHLEEHPEIGYRVIGYVRSSMADEDPHGVPTLGVAQDVVRILHEQDVHGAIVVPGALRYDERELVVSLLLDAGAHVHIATGISGVDSRRLRSSPMAHEPLLYVEQRGARASWYPRVARAIDVVGAVALLIITMPIMVVAAIAVRIEDGGPVLFRQIRVGKNARPFTLLKFRSMVVDAEERLLLLLEQNEREGGPLFKLEGDPRVTRVGAILRATSIDELPQLLCVLRGRMSLVGPRPALPTEVAGFDDRLRTRQLVRPGVTGLWQVEARDNPSFTVYRYLDVFYVDNQSLALDLAIIVGTVRTVIMSAVHHLRAPSTTVPEPIEVGWSQVGESLGEAS